MKKLLANLLKIGISAGIITYLMLDARGNDVFSQLRDGPKQWSLLLLAWLLLFTAVLVTIVRWYLLVRALELPFRLRDAFRLGFLGYLLNFVSLGSVGGDLFKAIFIAREQPGRRAEAVATVFIDRVIGLYAMFIVATIAILSTNLWAMQIPQIRVISRVTVLGAGLGAFMITMMLVPGITNGALSKWLSNLPRVGYTFRRLIGAVRIYRRRLPILVVALLMSIGVHMLATTGIYLVAVGLPGNVPSFGEHFLVVPLALVASALPLPLMGLGAFEAVIVILYTSLPVAVPVGESQGLVVALGYRIITILIAAVGAWYYVFSRREVSELMHEAEESIEENGALAVGGEAVAEALSQGGASQSSAAAN